MFSVTVYSLSVSVSVRLSVCLLCFLFFCTCTNKEIYKMFGPAMLKLKIVPTPGIVVSEVD